jgi:hypothetical protein
VHTFAGARAIAEVVRLYGLRCVGGRDEGQIVRAALKLTRRSALGVVGSIMTSALLDACGGGSDTSSAPASELTGNPQPVPSGPQTLSTVGISTSVVGSIGAGFAGLSYEKNSMAVPRFAPSNADLIGLFTRLGPSLLRIGGNSVDETQWAPNGAGRTSGEVAPSDIDALAGFLQASGWSVLYGVNLATSAPAAAAAEVAYAVQSLGSSLYAIEIGNEPDLYGGNYFTTWNLQDFEQLWGEFRSAIIQVAPTVRLTGPAAAGNIGTWTVPFGQYVASSEIVLLTQHYYRGNGQSASSTVAELISPDPVLVADLATLKAGAASIGVPFRITETNSFYNGGADGVSDSYASSLWVIDDLFNIALGGGTGANFHGGGDSDGYTPIADNDGVVVEARPEYYGLLLFTLAGQGTLLQTSVAAAGLNVTAYCVRSTNGALSIIVVNKDATQNLTLSVDTGQSVNSAALLVLGGPALSATSAVLIQGAAVAATGAFAPAAAYTPTVADGVVSCYVPAASAALIQIT